VASSIVLLSSGLDSVVNLAEARQKSTVKLALTFDYGQAAARREVENAAAICDYYKLKHRVIRLDWLAEFSESALTRAEKPLPEIGRAGLGSSEITQESARAVWVPNRNGVLINIAAAIAESLEADWIVTGFNAEEAVTFPDNSAAFVEAINRSLSYSTLSKIQVISLTQNLTKPQVVSRGVEMAIPWDLVWSCYRGEEKMCGRCESCQRLLRGIEQAGHPELRSKIAG